MKPVQMISQIKKLFFVIFVLIPFLGIAQKEVQNPNVLLIGNSYIAYNNLSQILVDIAVSAGDTLFYTENLPGASRFQNHVSNNSMTLIKQGGWDYVILQEQSQLPSFPIEQVETECFPYAKMLVDSVKKYNDDCTAMFFMTWGRENGDVYNCPVHPPVCTYEGMDNLLYERYMIMGTDNHAAVAPAGAVWRYLRTHHPEIELYDTDGSHPSLAGSYAAACTFHAMIFQKTLSLVNDKILLDDIQKRIIKKAVNIVVLDSLDKWLNNEIIVADFLHEKIEYEIICFPNPAKDNITIQFANETKFNDCIIKLYNTTGELVYKENIKTDNVFNINTSSMSKGIYYLKIISDNKIIYKDKLIIN